MNKPNTPSTKLLVAFRDEDSQHGVTRESLQRMARIKGLSETALIHLALANLRNTLPNYEPDDGPFTPAQRKAIEDDVLAKHPESAAYVRNPLTNGHWGEPQWLLDGASDSQK